jgi:spore coat polysaccharide biosynthesis protein SpsF
MLVDCIVQARMGSTRLPGKVLMNLNNETLLSSLFEQLKFSKSLNRKIIATTTNQEDAVIVDFAKSQSIEIFRGSSSDVLDRYYQCAKSFSLKHIVRITADNPLIDPMIIDKVIDVYKNEKYDYVNNFTNRTFPYGTEVEVFSFETLEKTWKEAKAVYDREHVTPYIYNNPTLFLQKCVESSHNYSNFRWTVDTVDDLNYVRTISKTKKHPILMGDIITLKK